MTDEHNDSYKLINGVYKGANRICDENGSFCMHKKQQMMLVLKASLISRRWFNGVTSFFREKKKRLEFTRFFHFQQLCEKWHLFNILIVTLLLSYYFVFEFTLEKLLTKDSKRNYIRLFAKNENNLQFNRKIIAYSAYIQLIHLNKHLMEFYRAFSFDSFQVFEKKVVE